MTTELEPTLDQAWQLARRLQPRDRARLLALIAQDIAATPEAPTAAPPAGDYGTAAALLAFGEAWDGDDLAERLAEVYASRQPVEG